MTTEYLDMVDCACCGELKTLVEPYKVRQPPPVRMVKRHAAPLASVMSSATAIAACTSVPATTAPAKSDGAAAQPTPTSAPTNSSPAATQPTSQAKPNRADEAC